MRLSSETMPHIPGHESQIHADEDAGDVLHEHLDGDTVVDSVVGSVITLG